MDAGIGAAAPQLTWPLVPATSAWLAGTPTVSSGWLPGTICAGRRTPTSSCSTSASALMPAAAASGRRLLEELERRLADRSIHRVLLLIGAGGRAEAFYRAAGYSTTNLLVMQRCTRPGPVPADAAAGVL